MEKFGLKALVPLVRLEDIKLPEVSSSTQLDPSTENHEDGIASDNKEATELEKASEDKESKEAFETEEPKDNDDSKNIENENDEVEDEKEGTSKEMYDHSLTIGADLSSMLYSLSLPQDHLRHRVLDTFQSPWAETSRSEVQPRFFIPKSFTNIPDILQCPSTPPVFNNIETDQQRVALFQDETLFFLFYKHPGTVIQELTYLELRKRNWRFHKTLKAWLTKDPAMEPLVAQDGFSERGSYVFFDPQRWERCQREFVLFYNSIM